MCVCTEFEIRTKRIGNLSHFFVLKFHYVSNLRCISYGFVRLPNIDFFFQHVDCFHSFAVLMIQILYLGGANDLVAFFWACAWNHKRSKPFQFWKTHSQFSNHHRIRGFGMRSSIPFCDFTHHRQFSKSKNVRTANRAFLPKRFMTIYGDANNWHWQFQPKYA